MLNSHYDFLYMVNICQDSYIHLVWSQFVRHGVERGMQASELYLAKAC